MSVLLHLLPPNRSFIEKKIHRAGGSNTPEAKKQLQQDQQHGGGQPSPALHSQADAQPAHTVAEPATLPPPAVPAAAPSPSPAAAAPQLPAAAAVAATITTTAISSSSSSDGLAGAYADLSRQLEREGLDLAQISAIRPFFDHADDDTPGLLPWPKTYTLLDPPMPPGCARSVDVPIAELSPQVAALGAQITQSFMRLLPPGFKVGAGAVRHAFAPRARARIPCLPPTLIRPTAPQPTPGLLKRPGGLSYHPIYPQPPHRHAPRYSDRRRRRRPLTAGRAAAGARGGARAGGGGGGVAGGGGGGAP
jgi:hypothetical protein